MLGDVVADLGTPAACVCVFVRACVRACVCASATTSHSPWEVVFYRREDPGAPAAATRQGGHEYSIVTEKQVVVCASERARACLPVTTLMRPASSCIWARYIFFVNIPYIYCLYI